MKNLTNLEQKYRSHFAFCKKSILCFVSVALAACTFLSGCHATIPKTEPHAENDSTSFELEQQLFEEPTPENSYEDLGFTEESKFFNNPQENVSSNDSSDELDIYVYQMNANSYKFIVLPHSETPRSLLELLSYTPVKGDNNSLNLQDVQKLISDNNIEKDQVYIIPYQHPLSSYISDYSMIIEGEDIEAKRLAYLENIYDMIFEIEINN